MKKKPLFLAFGLFASTLSLATLDLNNLYNYDNQSIPSYITKSNEPLMASQIDEGATLGRVLFYDKQLSLNGTIACASCHHQAFAFSDTAVQSRGFNGGLTGRHSMRLANARFGDERKFFWNERASSLEDQTTRPIQDEVEMGFSGQNGQPDIDSLIRRMEQISYYQTLFTFAYGDAQITEARIQEALAKFVRSIQSFDSKFDQGLTAANGNLTAPFANFTAQENQGKQLFLAPPPQGGAGCQGCHRAPEFDIDPNTLNNGITGVAGSPGQRDFTVTRAPSLRDLFNPQGQLNGPLMHTGFFTDINTVINHYNLVPQDTANTNLDARLQGPGGVLNLNQTQKDALAAFLRTLSGSAVYTDARWSDPFDMNGNLDLIPLGVFAANASLEFKVYPNPSRGQSYLESPEYGTYQLRIFDAQGRQVQNLQYQGQNTQIDLQNLPAGTYILHLQNLESKAQAKQILIRQ